MLIQITLYPIQILQVKIHTNIFSVRPHAHSLKPVLVVLPTVRPWDTVGKVPPVQRLKCVVFVEQRKVKPTDTTGKTQPAPLPALAPYVKKPQAQ